MTQALLDAEETPGVAQKPSDGDWAAVVEIGPIGKRGFDILYPDDAVTRSHVLRPAAHRENSLVLLEAEKPFIVRQIFMNSSKPVWNALVAQPVLHGRIQKMPRLSPALPFIAHARRRWTPFATLAERVKFDPEKLWERFSDYRTPGGCKRAELDVSYAPGHGADDPIAWVGKTTSEHLDQLEFWHVLDGKLVLFNKLIFNKLLFTPSECERSLSRFHVPTAWAESVCRVIEGIADLRTGPVPIGN